MAYKYDRAAGSRHVIHLSQTLLLKLDIADRQNLVHQQNLRL